LKKNKMNNPFIGIPGMSAMRCPYCGSPVVLRSADGIYKENHANTKLYVCSRYPACDAYVRVHEGTNKPVGSLADHICCDPRVYFIFTIRVNLPTTISAAIMAIPAKAGSALYTILGIFGKRFAGI